jgi:glycosyltransferase involved in cell wall biosynthesis
MDYQYSIIIPAFNESSSIEATLSELQQFDEHYEIIVVDDGSTDDTYEIACKSGVRVIQHDVNKGYGASLKTGIKFAKNNIIVITDADGTYPNQRIPELVRIFYEENQDMVVGARIGDNVNIPLIRLPAKIALNKLANFLAGVKIPDLNSGLRVMDKHIVMKFLNIICDGFSFTTTITLCMLTNDYHVKYIPINYNIRQGKSKIKPVSDTLNFLQLIVRTSMYFNPLRIFLPLSVALFLSAWIVLVGSHFIIGQVMDVTFGVILMASIIILAIGMLADLIDKRIS